MQINFPVATTPRPVMITTPRVYFNEGPILTIYHVLVRESNGTFEKIGKKPLQWIYMIKLGGNRFMRLTDKKRYQLGTASRQEHITGFREIGSNPSKECFYIYEVHEHECILNIGERKKNYVR